LVTLVLLSNAAFTAAYLSSGVISFCSSLFLAASAFAFSSASFFNLAFSFFFWFFEFPAPTSAAGSDFFFSSCFG